MKPENSDAKQGNPGQWRPGQSGNPSGKPRGAINRTTRAVLELLDGESEALTRKAVELAMDGDTTALRICMERIAPPVKDAPISVTLPTVEGAEDAPKAMAAVLDAMANGQITPSEAGAVAGIVEAYRRSVETAELERRIAALEAENGE